jgi:uncharacterized protein DUF4129
MTTQRVRIAVAVCIVLAGLGLALIGSRSGQQLIDPPPPGPHETAAPPPPPATSTGQNGDPHGPPGNLHPLAGLYIIIGAGIMLLALGGVPLFLPHGTRRFGFRRRHWRQHRRPDPVRRGGPVLLAEAVESALATLDTGTVDDAIVGCWVALERAAAQAGTPRLAAETSTELTERVLTEHQVSPDTLRDLAALYREARYSRHPLGEPDRERARALFEQVRAQLRVMA